MYPSVALAEAQCARAPVGAVFCCAAPLSGRTDADGLMQPHVLVIVTFAWSFSLNRSSPGSSKRFSGALSATLAFDPGCGEHI